MSRLSLALLCLALAGCATAPRLSNSDRLMQRPDFTQAAQTAPDWVSDALLTINRLEYQIESK